MDKNWLSLSDRLCDEYVSGVESFLNFAFFEKQIGARICCPCVKCKNRFFKSREDVMLHCLRDGFDNTYRNWTCHGEIYIPLEKDKVESTSHSNLRDDMTGMLYEAMGIPRTDGNVGNDEEIGLGANVEMKKLLELLEDAEIELFPGCRKQTKLSFLARLLHIKTLSGWSNKSFDLLLELLKDSFPDGVNLPTSYYEANKITTELDFTYETIDVCVNSCMLFRGEHGKLDKCEICGEPRYTNEAKNKSRNRMRYFPLKPRLQKLFMSSETSSHMRWHAEKRIDDGVLRHPADSLAWKNFDQRFPSLKSDIRNVRLGLATDGFNPFGNMNVSYSIWPVVLIVYNLPPWLCMKQHSFILSTVIDGPKGPGNNIDVCLQRLIEDLKELWDVGVETYDASNNQIFQLHAALLWTISDFPGYGIISGWSTKGEYACPNCGRKTRSEYLYNGHRRFLPIGHCLRRDKISFDGTIEFEHKPSPLSEMELLQEVEGIPTVYKKEDLKVRMANGKKKSKKRKFGETVDTIWKKKSIFFELPYWAGNLIRHNLDVMHIEKNICDNIIFTLLGTKGKTKDNLNARKDLQKMNIRKPLHPIPRPSGGFYLPATSATMSSIEKAIFCRVLKSLRPPDGYASNIPRHVSVEKHTIWGLKSHDNHVLMQNILPIALRRALPKDVVKVFIELSNFFRTICSKVNTTSDLEKIQDRIALTLCHLEKIFPPGFFDIMEHLPIHLAEEALLVGPVQFRWMYPVERYLGTLKKYVRNRAHPEGSIAKGYLMEECMNFCSRYFNNVETKANRQPRNYEGDADMGRGLYEGNRFIIDRVTLLKIHRYVLENSDIVSPYHEKHKLLIRREKPRSTLMEIQRIHSETFHDWLRSHVKSLRVASDPELPTELIALANGPIEHVKSYKACIVRGCRYRVKTFDANKKTQCSGVVVHVDTLSFASSKDLRPRSGKVSYYGILTNIIEIEYTREIKFWMFQCDWVDNEKGVKEDEFKFTLVNFNRLMYDRNLPTDEPFVLASQVQQVWYIPDPVDPDWNVVVPMSRRDNYVVYSTAEVEPHSSIQLDDSISNSYEDSYWVRDGIEGVFVDEAYTTMDGVET